MNFKKPDISEIRSVEKLAQDDAFATLARSMRAIQEGKASSADIKRYLDAKAYIDPDRLAKTVEKERLANLSGKYKNVGEEEIAKISRLRDYLMSHPDLKYGNEFNPQQVKALLYDLKTQGKPRSLKYDEMYDNLMGMYEELGKRIEEAYGAVKQTDAFADEPLDANGNPVFANPHIGSGLAAGSGNALEFDEEGNIKGFDAEKFVTGFAMGALGSKASASVLKKYHPKLYNDILGVSREYPSMAASNPKLLSELYKTAKDASVNTFAGAKAVRADAGKLDDAMKLSYGGASEADIWKKTGWFKGDDGKWRFEVDDSGARINIDLFQNGFNGTLKDILAHNNLYEVYPNLKDMVVKVRNIGVAKGRLNNSLNLGNYIELNPFKIQNANDVKSTLLHEVQHAVQQIENFARGGSVQNFETSPSILKQTEAELQGWTKMYNEAWDKFSDAISKGDEKEIALRKSNLDWYGEHLDNIKMNLKTQQDPRGAYQRLHGEAEARLTQTRADKGYENFPLDDLDVPRDELIKKFDGGTAQMSIETESRYINPKNGNLTSQFKKDAIDMPKPLNKKEFAKQYGDTYGWTSVDTPIGKIKFNVNSAYKHMSSDNTYFTDRVDFSGAFDMALRDPLMVVKNPLKDGQKEYYLPLKDDKNDILHFINIAKDKNGELKQITFFDVSEEEAKRIIKSQGSNILYFKYSTATKHLLGTGDAMQIPKKSPPTNQSIPQNKEEWNKNLLEWRKDSHPLTKNADGTPKVFYHGTGADFDEFQTGIEKANGSRAGEGVYLTTNYNVANSYAKKINSSVMPVYINSKNIFTGVENLTPKQREYYLNTEKPVNEILKDLGFDARMSGDEIVVFNPTQIKSIHNKGTFDDANPNILYSLPLAGAVDATQGEK